MFFRNRDRQSTDVDQPDPWGDPDDVTESDKQKHGRYTIIPRAKQLYNGNSIVRITLQETKGEDDRRYDFAGPMSEFPSRDEAIRGGIQHAVARLGD